MRTASEKLRNRSSFSTNVVYATPGTRVNRYIGRLLEARQTDLEMADLNFFTLKYKQAEREQKVGDCGQEWPGALHAASFSWSGGCRPCRCCRGSGHWWCPREDRRGPVDGSTACAFLCLQYHQLQDEYFTSAVVLALLLAALFGLIYLLIIPQ